MKVQDLLDNEQKEMLLFFLKKEIEEKRLGLVESLKKYYNNEELILDAHGVTCMPWIYPARQSYSVDIIDYIKDLNVLLEIKEKILLEPKKKVCYLCGCTKCNSSCDQLKAFICGGELEL